MGFFWVFSIFMHICVGQAEETQHATEKQKMSNQSQGTQSE